MYHRRKEIVNRSGGGYDARRNIARPWPQVYDPAGHGLASALLVVLVGLLVLLQAYVPPFTRLIP